MPQQIEEGILIHGAPGEFDMITSHARGKVVYFTGDLVQVAEDGYLQAIGCVVIEGVVLASMRSLTVPQKIGFSPFSETVWAANKLDLTLVIKEMSGSAQAKLLHHLALLGDVLRCHGDLVRLSYFPSYRKGYVTSWTVEGREAVEFLSLVSRM